jgi:two-component system OmpR family response regulator
MHASQITASSAAPVHVLAVDDDCSLRTSIADYLGTHDIRVTALDSGRDISDVMQRELVDLLILDLKLPGEDGLQITHRLRSESNVPIIMLSGRDEEADRVMALEFGADDYITKPFSPRELVARIRTVLRRHRTETKAARPTGVRAYRFDGWVLNLNTRCLTSRDGRSVPLTNGEFNLLVVFANSPQRVLSRDQLLDLSRLHSDEVYDRCIDVQILRLRRKMEADLADLRYIKTERGVGYIFTVPVETIT